MEKEKRRKTGNTKYKVLHKEVNCKRDKEQFLESKCLKIESCMKENKTKEMYEENLTKT